MLRFIDREDYTDAQLAKPWADQDGRWQVIFECAHQGRQLDYCREQPPTQLSETDPMGLRAMTRPEVAAWARQQVAMHPQVNACRIDWF